MPARPGARYTVRMLRAARAGLLYFLVAFAAGLALGILRALVVAPAIGETLAVLVELPVILAIGWAACRRLTVAVPATLSARLAMGGVALALLAGAEALLGAGLGRPPAAQLAALGTPPGALGLAGQVAFGLLPAVQLRR
jgi:hypothetical protein